MFSPCFNFFKKRDKLDAVTPNLFAISFFVFPLFFIAYSRFKYTWLVTYPDLWSSCHRMELEFYFYDGNVEELKQYKLKIIK